MAPPLAAECGLGQKVSDPILVLQGPKPQSQQHSGPEKIDRGLHWSLQDILPVVKGVRVYLGLKEDYKWLSKPSSQVYKVPASLYDPDMAETPETQRDIPDIGDADSVIFRLPHSSSSFLSIMDREGVHDFRRCWPLNILMSTKSTAKINYSWFE